MQFDFLADKIICQIFDIKYKDSQGIFNKFHINNDVTRQSLLQQNFANIKQDLNASSIFVMKQTHSADIIDVTKDTDIEQIFFADGAITAEKNIALGIITADCVPVILASEDGKVVGAAHCGWRGAKQDIIKNVIDKMRSYSREIIHAIIGPAIQQKSYEVDKAFYLDFIAEDKNNSKFFIDSKRINHYMFDLVGYVAHKLQKENVKIAKISDHDTYSMPEQYPSYRRFTHNKEPYNSNILSVVMIK